MGLIPKNQISHGGLFEWRSIEKRGYIDNCRYLEILYVTYITGSSIMVQVQNNKIDQYQVGTGMLIQPFKNVTL